MNKMSLTELHLIPSIWSCTSIWEYSLMYRLHIYLKSWLGVHVEMHLLVFSSGKTEADSAIQLLIHNQTWSNANQDLAKIPMQCNQ